MLAGLIWLRIGPNGRLLWTGVRTFGVPLSKEFIVSFQFLTTASMKMTALWDTELCSIKEVDRCFRGAYSLHHQGDEWSHW
jgi:hypothetical protein